MYYPPRQVKKQANQEAAQMAQTSGTFPALSDNVRKSPTRTPKKPAPKPKRSRK